MNRFLLCMIINITFLSVGTTTLILYYKLQRVPPEYDYTTLLFRNNTHFPKTLFDTHTIQTCLIVVHVYDNKRLEALQDTWFKDFFYPSQIKIVTFSSTLHKSKVDLYIDETSDLKKMEVLWHWVYANYEGYDWYYKCDDDTFLYQENFEKKIKSFPRSSEEPYYFGFPIVNGIAYASGGAGYFFNNVAFKTIIKNPFKCDVDYEDMCLGRWMLDNDITVHDPQGLHPLNPLVMLLWYFYFDQSQFWEFVKPLDTYTHEYQVSYHYVKPTEMYLLNGHLKIPSVIYHMDFSNEMDPDEIDNFRGFCEDYSYQYVYYSEKQFIRSLKRPYKRIYKAIKRKFLHEDDVKSKMIIAGWLKIYQEGGMFIVGEEPSLVFDEKYFDIPDNIMFKGKEAFIIRERYGKNIEVWGGNRLNSATHLMIRDVYHLFGEEKEREGIEKSKRKKYDLEWSYLENLRKDYPLHMNDRLFVFAYVKKKRT